MNVNNKPQPSGSKTRAAIYARFSSDLQNDRSIEDQVELCRDYCARNGLTVSQVFHDYALSGASIFGRNGLIAMMAAADSRAFDCVVTECGDRISRDMEDSAGIHKRLTFLGIDMIGVFEGKATTIQVGLRGLVGQLYLEDMANKLRRAAAGRVRDGLVPAGLTYGYAPLPGEGNEGRRVIVEAEAAIVRRIFDRYLAGVSPRDIAAQLNRESIPAPRGAHWNASTINGNPRRGYGILHNPLYAGRLVWNRVRMMKHPDTGRRISRPNPQAEWKTAALPDLAIVAPDIFDAVQARKQSLKQVRPEYQQRPKSLLSGLMRCGGCGGPLSVRGRDKRGGQRIRCSANVESKICPEPHSFALHAVENAVLSGLGDALTSPEWIAAYVRAYEAERRKLAADSSQARDRMERRLTQLAAEADRITDFMIRGVGDVTRMDAKAKELAAEEATLRQQLAALPTKPTVVAIHPATLDRYEQQLKDVREALNSGIQSGDTKAIEAIRALITHVTIRPDPTKYGKPLIEITGRLTALLQDASAKRSRLGISVVAAGSFGRENQPGDLAFFLKVG